MKKLSWRQRVALAEGIKAGKSNAQIARELGVHRSTVGREIARNADSRETYAPQEADLMSWQRQKEAMPKRFLISFCGVEFFSTLMKRNRIYTYISRTHLNTLCREQNTGPDAWESSYIQSPKMRFVPDYSFIRFSVNKFPVISFSFSGSQDSSHSFSSLPSSSKSPGPSVPGFSFPSDNTFSKPYFSDQRLSGPFITFSSEENRNEVRPAGKWFAAFCKSLNSSKKENVNDVRFCLKMKIYTENRKHVPDFELKKEGWREII